MDGGLQEELPGPPRGRSQRHFSLLETRCCCSCNCGRRSEVSEATYPAYTFLSLICNNRFDVSWNWADVFPIYDGETGVSTNIGFCRNEAQSVTHYALYTVPRNGYERLVLEVTRYPGKPCVLGYSAKSRLCIRIQFDESSIIPRVLFCVQYTHYAAYHTVCIRYALACKFFLLHLLAGITSRSPSSSPATTS